jgi:hypothetical protein
MPSSPTPPGDLSSRTLIISGLSTDFNVVLTFYKSHWEGSDSQEYDKADGNGVNTTCMHVLMLKQPLLCYLDPIGRHPKKTIFADPCLTFRDTEQRILRRQPSVPFSRQAIANILVHLAQAVEPYAFQEYVRIRDGLQPEEESCVDTSLWVLAECYSALSLQEPRVVFIPASLLTTPSRSFDPWQTYLLDDHV